MAINMTIEKFREYCKKKSKEEIVDWLYEKENGKIPFVAKEVAENEVSKGELAKLIEEELKNYIKTNPVIERVLFHVEKYDDRRTYYTPTEITKALFKDILDEEFYKNIQKDFEKYLKDNFELLARKVLLDIFVNGIKDNKIIQDSIQRAIYEMT